MANPDSWEDEEERLSQQARQMNLQPAAPSFQPNAPSFQPGAPYQQPGHGGQYWQYGQQGYGNQGYGNQGYGGQMQYAQYSHPGQQSYHGYPQYQQPGPQYGGYGQPEQQVHARPEQTANTAQTNPPVSRAPTLNASADAPAKAPQPSAPKTLTIKADTPSKAEATSTKDATSKGPKTLSIKDEANTKTPAAGNKTTAAKAIGKSDPSTTTTKPSGNVSPTPSSGRNSPSRTEQRAAAREANAVQKEQEAELDEETLREMYGKEHVNVIFLGHVDAGKSTLGGSILYATGMVDERTMAKYKQEAKDAGRETWYLSWALDLTKEERAKGKTVEVGRGFFETDKRRYSILDAPGHKTFVPEMIGGASQADVGILVISARKGEYETGFEKGGQTREHAMLAKTQGVNKLCVVINKMDDPTVEWSQDRYTECTSKLTLFLKGLGYNPKTDLTFMPISAQMSRGIKDRIPKELCPWYDGPSLLEFLDNMGSLERKVNAPFMMPVAAKYRDMGTMMEGKIESGVIKKSNNYLLMPNRETVSISALYGEQEDEIQSAMCGEQIRIRVRGVEEEDILPGFVLCSPKRPVHCVSAFEAHIVLLELRSILSAGFNCVLHVHAAQEEVTFTALLHKLEKGTNRKSKKPPGFATKGMSIIARLEVTGGAGRICVERFEDYPQLGRFTLRDQGQTIAIGKITKLLTDVSA